eukprot:272447-Prymnesium_polylepis.1
MSCASRPPPPPRFARRRSSALNTVARLLRDVYGRARSFVPEVALTVSRSMDAPAAKQIGLFFSSEAKHIPRTCCRSCRCRTSCHPHQPPSLQLYLFCRSLPALTVSQITSLQVCATRFCAASADY